MFYHRDERIILGLLTSCGHVPLTSLSVPSLSQQAVQSLSQSFALFSIIGSSITDAKAIMSLPSHLQMINAPTTGQENCELFPSFRLLPKELRLKIWRHAMQRQRFLKVCVKDRVRCGHDLPEPTSFQEPYCAHIDGHQVLPKYLRVNHESREETLRFYRVHLPCMLYTGQTSGKRNATPGMMYINPEDDYLYLSFEWSVKNTLFPFCCRIKNTHDPRHVGILNMAIDSNTLNSNDLCLLQPSDVNLEDLEKTREILWHLEEVFFVATPRAGRQVMGSMSGLPTGDTFWNRSMPIMARNSSFQRLEQDPRGIAEDLKKVHVGMSDPRTMYSQWLEFLKKWYGPSQASQTRYQFLLSFDPIIGEGEGILDRVTAEGFLHREEDRWTNEKGSESSTWFTGRDDIKWPIGATQGEYDAQDKASFVKPAFGFWLFPMEAMGPLQEEGVPENEGFRQRGKAILDLTKHWPELALLHVH